MTSRSRPAAGWIALAGAFAAVALVVYRRALAGPLVSDDVGYLLSPWVRHFDASSALAILDPYGAPAAHTANYAPLHLLAHALLFQAFGDALAAHHVANVLLHAACAAAVAALLARVGIPLAAAGFLGAVFLLHPANVEAVAWLSQLKSVLGLGLACAALLLEPRRPALAAAAFAAALLAKFQAAFALPVAAAALWLERPVRAGRGRRAAWLVLWALLLAAVSVPQLAAFERMGHVEASLPEGLAARVRFASALLGRYLALAATGWGASAFHEPPSPASWRDGWVLLGLAFAAAATARTALALARRDAEAVFWIWTAAALLPVSQLLSFRYPMADRYLYFALPGLLGALGMAARRPLARALDDPLRRAALALPALALLAAFALRSEARAALWRSELAVARDAAAHYPDGVSAQLLRASEAARRGDAEAALAALHAARARGFDGFERLERDPAFAGLREDPRFRALVAEVAGDWIAAVAPRAELTAQERLVLGLAHRARGEWEPALARLAEAAAAPGPTGARARAELAATRAARLRAAREAD
jgi:hypothetical protein